MPSTTNSINVEQEKLKRKTDLILYGIQHQNELMSSLQARSSIFLGIQTLFVTMLFLLVPDNYENIIQGSELTRFIFLASIFLTTAVSIGLIVIVIMPFNSLDPQSFLKRTWSKETNSLFFLPEKAKKFNYHHEFYTSIIEMDETELIKNLCYNLSMLEDRTSQKMTQMKRSIIMFTFSSSMFFSIYIFYYFEKYAPLIVYDFLNIIIVITALFVIFNVPQNNEAKPNEKGTEESISIEI